MALMRRTRIVRAVGWLACQLIAVPNFDDADQAALNAHIAALVALDSDATRVGHEPAQERSNPPRPIATSTPATSSAGVTASPAVASTGPPRSIGPADNGWATDGYTPR
jgi:hypothetical protein